MFLAQGLFSEKACLDHANCVKTYILHCKMYVFYNSGMIIQDSKIEIEAPESKTYILHCEMYVFFQFWGVISRFQAWNCSPRVENIHFTSLEWNFKVPNLKLKPQSQKQTFYTVKCMFSNFGMNFQCSKPEIEAPEFLFFQVWNKFQGSKPEI